MKFENEIKKVIKNLKTEKRLQLEQKNNKII